MSYSLDPEVEIELTTAADFYESQAGRALANAFLSEVGRAANLLGQTPSIGKPMRGGLRVHPLRRFPYSLVYRALPEGVLILVVGHQHRRPNYWRGRV